MTIIICILNHSTILPDKCDKVLLRFLKFEYCNAVVTSAPTSFGDASLNWSTQPQGQPCSPLRPASLPFLICPATTNSSVKVLGFNSWDPRLQNLFDPPIDTVKGILQILDSLCLPMKISMWPLPQICGNSGSYPRGHIIDNDTNWAVSEVTWVLAVKVRRSRLNPKNSFKDWCIDIWWYLSGVQARH